MNQNKKSRLTLKNKNDINNLEKEFPNNYEDEIKKLKDIILNKEMISGVEYTRNADTMRGIGLTVCLQGYQAQIFKYNY